jgi:ribosomal protein L11 methyltransferase
MPTETIQWPYLRLALPKNADPEMTGLLTQTAADNGALGAMTEGNSLLLYLPKDADEALVQNVIDAVLAEAEGIGWSGLAVDRDSLADQPWATAWKVDFKDIPIGQSLLIRPDWEMGQPAAAEWGDRKTIWLRPGSGFGTGRHETTRLALELLESNIDESMRVLDFGSGSGVLSIAAIKLGAASVTSIEMDPEANQNARENIELNKVTPRIYLKEGSTPEPEMGMFNLIIANMLPHEVLPRLEALAQRLDHDQEGVFVYSGFLLEQQTEIEAAFARVGLVAQSFAQEGEWGAMAGTLMHHVSLEY